MDKTSITTAKRVELRPVCYEHGKAMYLNSNIMAVARQSINNGQYFFYKNHRIKEMNDDIKKATDLLDEANELFNQRLNTYIKTQEKITDQTKNISRALRESTQQMGEGLSRIEKKANFTNLEKYVVLLERANAALSSLAELEKNGKLNKISEALK